MAFLTRDCPHCETNKSSFISLGEINHVNTKSFTVGFYCGSCFGGISAEVEMTAAPTPHQFKSDLDRSKLYNVIKTYPTTIDVESPSHLPENLSNFYLQAAKNLKSSNFDASAIMSRKVLEVAVKVLDSNGNGNLYDRIEALEKSRLITPDLKDWAHIIRDDGNFAAHEELPVPKEFADEIFAFAEMFLMYTFTMPNMIKERRHDENSHKA